MTKKIIPINKGNYSMESPERERLFDFYKGEGWWDEYQEYRRNWSRYAEEQYVSEYPLLVDIELSSLCNLRCPMCYTITEEFKQKVNAKLMDVELFKRIIDEIAGKVPAIRLSLRGEPMIHPNFVEAVKYAKQKGIKEVSTLTNGSKLTANFFQEIMAAGIDWITISVDGVNETYEKIRRPLRFAETLHKIKEIKRMKDESGRKKPVIKVQSIWPAIQADPETFYRTFAPYVDMVAFNPLIDFNDTNPKIVYLEGFSCPQLYQRLVVGADGRTMMCSNDEENTHVVGDANVQTIFDIWHGEIFTQVRELHKKTDGFKEIPVCRKCYLPRLTEDSEKATVEGREFRILNYVKG